MKNLVCKAFCDAISLRKVPMGYAVETPYANSEGDPLVFYLAHVPHSTLWTIEDDGMQIPLLEASGIDIRPDKQRGKILNRLLNEYGATFDKEARVIKTNAIPENKIGSAAVNFLALLLRIQDLFSIDQKMVRATWKEDAITALTEAFSPFASVEVSAPIDEDDEASPHADLMVSGESSAPLAIYFGTSEERALKALVHKMEFEKYRGVRSRVALLLEKAKDNPISEPTYSLAQARLDRVLSFRGAERDAVMGLVNLYREQATA